MSADPVESEHPASLQKKIKNDCHQPQSFEPALWSKYFNIRDDIELEVGRFRIYRRGVEGPLLFFIHGGGFSALTWAVLSATITEQVKCQCLAVDMRGHGDTSCQDDDDLSIDTLSRDVIKIIFAMYPTEAPPIVLVGHSMGGAVAVHVAHKRTIPSLAGLVVIDVVEGSAISSLRGMTNFLRNRPQGFQSLSQAIEWSVRSCQLRNVHSACVSFPGQLKRTTTGETATHELEEGTALVFPHLSSESNHSSVNVHGRGRIGTSSNKPPSQSLTKLAEHDETAPPDHEGGSIKQPEADHSFKCSDVNKSDSGTCPATSCSPLNTTLAFEYSWRIDLLRTEPFWQDWFLGLSQRFLSIPEPKLLLLAGVDRLDKDLTIGQMQGKFQLHVFPKCGHAVQEDSPDKVAECLARFLVRNRFTEARSNCGI